MHKPKKSKLTLKGVLTVLGGFIAHVVNLPMFLIFMAALRLHLHLGQCITLCDFLLKRTW